MEEKINYLADDEYIRTELVYTYIIISNACTLHSDDKWKMTSYIDWKSIQLGTLQITSNVRLRVILCSNSIPLAKTFSWSHQFLNLKLCILTMHEQRQFRNSATHHNQSIYCKYFLYLVECFLLKQICSIAVTTISIHERSSRQSLYVFLLLR